AAAQCGDGSIDDVAGRIEVRFADLEVHDLAALRFQRFRPGENFEGGFRSESGHSPGNSFHDSPNLSGPAKITFARHGSEDFGFSASRPSFESGRLPNWQASRRVAGKLG